MLKKTIKYKNYDEEDVVGDFWFHLTKAELLELKLIKGEGFDVYLAKLAETQDMAEILPLFKEIISLTVGERDEENKRFVKSKEFTDNFMYSEAYSELFLEFMTDTQAFITFINGVMPKDLAEMVDFSTGQLKVPNSADTTASPRQVQVIELPKEVDRTYEQYTEEELMAMPMAQFDKLTTGDPRKMTKEQLQMAYRRATQANTIKE